MPNPTWYFVAILERNISVDDLAREFNNLCQTQPGVKNHGWCVISNKPKRFQFQLISEVQLDQETLYDLSMTLHDTAEVISEATNCLTAYTEPQFGMVYVVDTGYLIVGRNPNIDEFSARMNSDYKVSFCGQHMTISFTGRSKDEVNNVRKEVEGLIKKNRQMVIVNVFKNWKG